MSSPPSASASLATPDLRWHDLRDLGLCGQGWRDAAEPYGRLPAHAQSLVTESVWSLGRHSAGLWVDFESDARSIHARCSLRAEPAQGQGFIKYLDLYARDADGRWRWGGVSRHGVTPTGKTPLIADLPAEWRTWRLYLPLCYVVDTLSIGVPADAQVQRVAIDLRPPVVVYGTSIVHGLAHLSRPGMAWPSIVGRRLDWPIVNLGFSGSARMEPPLAGVIAELEAAVLVVDPLPNMSLELIQDHAEPFLCTWLAAHPGTPVLLVEDRTHSHSWLLPDYAPRQAAKRAAWHALYEQLRSEGHPIHYLAGTDLLGHDGDGTTDGSHPSDLGAWRYAEEIAPAIARLLPPPSTPQTESK